MNLVEQQEKARALPMQYLQQAVNGQSVELAPWIATAELQRRTTADQHMQAAKGPQGPQPTVKDQIEQKAGLMATQAAQLAQATQAQQSSPPPGPIPGGIPEPEPQPKEPVMAAHGGLMNAPVSFNFAHGGILGYAGPQGSDVKDPDAEQLASDRQAVTEGLKKFGYAAADIAAMPFRAASALLNTLIVRPTRAVTGAEVPYFPMLGGGDSGSVTPFSDRAYQEKQAVAKDDRAPLPSLQSSAARRDDRAPLPSLQGITAALPKPAPRPRVAQEQDQAQDQRPAPAQAPAPMDAAGKAALTFATGVTPERTLADIIAEQRAIKKEAGTDQPMGVNQAAQQARQDEIQKRRDAHAKELAYSAYVQGLVGTPGSAKLAYDRTLATALADEGTYGQAKYKNIAELEAAQRAAAEKQQTALETPVAAGRLASAAERKDRANTGANIYGTNKQFDASKYSVDKHAETALAVQKLQDRAAAARQNSTDQKLALAELTQLERSYDADIKSFESQLRPLVDVFTPEARAKVKELNIQLDLARDLKRRVRGSSAAPAGTITPPPPGAVRLKKG